MGGVSCPSCTGTKLQRYGKTAAGLQKYKCLDGLGVGCKRQFVTGSDRRIDKTTRETVLPFLSENVKVKSIKVAAPRISL